MSKPSAPIELPVLQPAGRTERADASRNRERILCEARRLFEARGVTCVSMDDIAAAAEVGKGTLYRRFGDRSGLALALLESDDVDLQEGFLRGNPPLGPGAPPFERLLAFFAALATFTERHRELIVEAQRTAMATGRFGSGPYGAYHTHVRLLLRELNPSLDVDVLAHLLLAPFRAELFEHLILGSPQLGRQRLSDAVERLLDGLR